MSAREVVVAHALPGRTRLRVEGARLTEEEATHLAEALAALPGVTRIEVNRRTGSAVCVHAPELPVAEMLERAHHVVGSGRQPPEKERAPAGEGASELAVEIARAFRGLNEDVRRASGGELDLGVLAALTFFGAGVVQITLDKQIPAPPWFNLAWWGFRTFMTLEQAAVGAPNAKPTEPSKT